MTQEDPQNPEVPPDETTSSGKGGSKTSKGKSEKSQDTTYGSDFIVEETQPDDDEEEEEAEETSHITLEPTIPETETSGLTVLERVLRMASYVILMLAFPISAWFCLKRIQPYETGIAYQYGKIRTVSDGGFLLLNPLTDSFIKIDRRIVAVEPGQQVIVTNDGFVILAESIVHFRVVDPVMVDAIMSDVVATIRALYRSDINKIMRELSFDDVFTYHREVEEWLEQGTVSAIEIEKVDVFIASAWSGDEPEDEEEWDESSFHKTPSNLYT